LTDGAIETAFLVDLTDGLNQAFASRNHIALQRHGG
jgi:hypothetical protein